jgi:hypothetical protein
MSRTRIGLVASLGVALVVAGCGGSSPSAAPTAVPSAAATAGTAYLGSFSGAGTYVTGMFVPKLSVTVPAGWKPGPILGTFVGSDETNAGFVLNDGKAVVIVTVPTSIYPPAPGDTGQAVPDAASLLKAFAADTHLKNASATTPVTIAGATGAEFEADLDASYSCGCPDPGYRMTDYLLVKPGSHVRIAAVTTTGNVVMVVATIAPAADWAAESTAADAIVASLALAK